MQISWAHPACSRQHRSGAGTARRRGSAVNPSFETSERIDDTFTQLAIGQATRGAWVAIDCVLTQAEKARSFMRA